MMPSGCGIERQWCRAAVASSGHDVERRDVERRGKSGAERCRRSHGKCLGLAFTDVTTQVVNPTTQVVNDRQSHPQLTKLPTTARAEPSPLRPGHSALSGAGWTGVESTL
ncbi:hypothetical protein [Ilumatobacter coccineus]|uniref:Uncharacterized protein n=1 Tax=Ilumatobacter coccineus (strain NBRC 103263 / KCTC 29153 / YM16-304) TaxID=1313172 RepID=A0A6C7E628_ILUCY|nr:hypothetical protein [Ilumatobacter coccineus]BAN03194.1 hypothetical protein YM304_28800 [Ilumatobacter coccineus YM16-304]